jgi:OmpA-OmpF porin, OOP family
MRSSSYRAGFAAFVLVAALPVAAWSQANPSSDDIIRSLRPGAGMTGGTRGIRPVMPAPDSGAAAAPTSVPSGPGAPRHAAGPRATRPAASAVATDEAPSVNLNVQFANGSADLTPAAVRTLNALGRALASDVLANSRFRIEGHTDTLGNPDANKALSDRRAATVVDYLVEHFKLDRSKLEAVGMGEEGLLVTTPPQTLEPRNRRVQVINLGA